MTNIAATPQVALSSYTCCMFACEAFFVVFGSVDEIAVTGPNGETIPTIPTGYDDVIRHTTPQPNGAIPFVDLSSYEH